VNGFVPRADDESIEQYVVRQDFGPYTKANLLVALESANRLDQVSTTAAVASARDHHDDPNPADTKPRKK